MIAGEDRYMDGLRRRRRRDTSEESDRDVHLTPRAPTFTHIDSACFINAMTAIAI